MLVKDPREQIRIISKGVNEIISLEDLSMKIKKSIVEDKPLTVKLGLDPSAPDIHLGHAVVLRKMKQLQDMGHNVVIIIGDFTGMIGDPTGKSKTRKQLTRDEVIENAVTYEKQIFKILDREKTKVRFNSEWLGRLSFKDVIILASKTTVARMLEREDFKNRFATHQSIGVHEFFYPLMQGYDSVELHADIEVGGVDQRFNILMGRTLQKDYFQEIQTALFMPLLEGIDGVNKMSKSLGNYVGINEAPYTMYEKLMTIPDGLIIKYYELATDVHPDDIDIIKENLRVGTVNPRDIKMNLSKEIVKLYHGDMESERAEEKFKQVFQNKKIPDNLPQVIINEKEIASGKFNIVDLLIKSGLVSSRAEAKRLIIQGGIRVNSESVKDPFKADFRDSDIIQIGKARFLRLVVSP